MTIFRHHAALAVVTLALVFLASATPALSVSLAPNVANTSTYGANDTTWNTYATFNTTNLNSIESLAARIINFILGFLGILAVIFVLVSGWQWMVADSEDKVKEARKRLINSVIALAIIALAWVIGYAIINSIAAITAPPTTATPSTP